MSTLRKSSVTTALMPVTPPTTASLQSMSATGEIGTQLKGSTTWAS